MTACVNTAFLPTDSSKNFAPTTSVEVLWEAPGRPYEIIGKVTAEAGSDDQEEIFLKLRERAALAGAHAIVMLDDVTSIVGSPGATGGTMIQSRLRMEAYAIRWAEEP
jgi:hypothetical protein